MTFNYSNVVREVSTIRPPGVVHATPGDARAVTTPAVCGEVVR